MMSNNAKIIRACTVSQSFDFVEGVLPQLMEKYEVVLIASPEKDVEEIRKEYPARYIPIQMNRRMSPVADLKSLVQIIRVFRKERPQMVHSMTPKAGLLCMMAAWLTRVPARVHTFTGLVWPTATGFSRKVLMLTDKITCACATHIIPEGQGVLNDLRHGGITKKPMKVLGYGNVKGVDMVRFSRRPEVMEKARELHDDSKFTFVFVGRIVRDKGMDELTEAFKKLQENHPQARLWLIGKYEDSLDPISDNARKEIADNAAITAIGAKYGDNLLAYYAAADCFVFPSYREGFPNTVMEAGAMGLPSIVTDINGSREIIVEGKNGLIIPSKDADALYEAMTKMLEDKSMRHQMAEAARPMIGSRFEQGFVQQCLLDYYDEILN